MRILLLEDDYNLAESIKEILEMENYTVDIANNAEEAYSLTFNNKYDLYIFDINIIKYIFNIGIIRWQQA